MDSNIKELIKKEKERRKLIRNEKKKKEKIKEETNLNLSEESNLKIPKNLFLNIQKNYENNIGECNEENEDIYKSNISKKECNILNEGHYKEPMAPVNKLNKNCNLKEAFSKYNNKKDDYIFEKNENEDTSKNIEYDKISSSIDIKNNDNLPEDFFDSFKTSDNINNILETKNCEKIEIDKNLNNNMGNDITNEKEEKNEIMKTSPDIQFDRNSKNEVVKNHLGDKYNLSVEQQNNCITKNEYKDENDDDVEILETYEIIEPTNNLDFKKNDNILKKKLEKRKKSENNENEEDENEVYKKIKKESNTNNINDEIENNNYIQELYDSNLDDLVYYKPIDTAYYEELDYLHKMLIEKKKSILGNMYDEDKERNEENEEDILEELNEFHKKKNKEKEKNSNFNINEIYEILNIKKGEHKNDFLDEIVNKNQENNLAKKNTHSDNIPKGFFDNKEKDIFIREKISLSTLNQKIAEIKKQKKNILLEYKNIEKTYEEKKNNYIDYLYDDKYDNKTKILNELKKKTTNLEHLKDKITKIRKEKKKKKLQKKVNAKFDDNDQIIYDWRKKSFF
ncbi:conserved Plasmodium protein, unknown function [Plasmodium gallinaceum]|uniref:Uncharacterized protein n=1 Tax=Plasmodium gallinaceum TaxID=5849 RepID=A0A1J1GN60_PLAGA|nr:conserved Plasmodium protein, unknown function [Plasmodium gallinaceum]CRG93905.1 conserved Plasmodium protein, unknown function [Plasmodium gallinaceum]